MEARNLGKEGEDAACNYLEGNGYQILSRNWRGEGGELDVVAKKGTTVVFVEVKSRSTSAFGEPEESITVSKKRRIRRLALEYIEENLLEQDCRFDVIGIMVKSDGQIGEIRHIKGAF
ncbi:MAG: YraN family protein [Actinomycetota bacterium]|nr:YraN family protein [Actinomycetota bacterium]